MLKETKLCLLLILTRVFGKIFEGKLTFPGLGSASTDVQEFKVSEEIHVSNTKAHK
jgi:hypothetical protein